MTSVCVRASLVAACWLFGSTIRADVLINEFVASNDTGLTDEDGEFPDWIELYNSGLETVDIGGYHLTDDAAAPLKWTLPPYLLPPGGYVIIFASGKDRDEAQFHTNFSLLSAGEHLALTDGAGVVLQVFSPYPAQSEDISYGLSEPVAEAPRVYFSTPTPGSANSTYGQLAQAPAFSVSSRTFSTPFTVAIASAAPGGELRYTTDGTLPVGTSTLYTTPLTVSQTTRLRARAFLSGQAASIPGGETYIQLAGDVLNVSSNLPLMILENFSAGRPTNGALAEWMIFEPSPPDGRSSLAATPSLASRSLIKVRGSSTANAARYSLAIETRNQLEQDYRVEPLGWPAESDWVLNAPFEYDRTLIHNPLLFQLSNELGRDASRTRQVELYLNADGGPVSQADYFGVYTLMEKITRGEDRVDIEKLQPSHSALPEITGGYLMKIDRGDPATPGQPADVGISAAGQQLYWVDPKEQEATNAQRSWITAYLNAFSAALTSASFRDPAVGYAAFLKVDAAIDHHLLNVVAKNVDALRLSTYLSKDRGGKLEFGPLWDFDRAMDSMDGRDNNFNTWRGETGDLGTDFFRYPWWNDLFRDGNFWQRWIDRFAVLRSGVLSTAHVHAAIASMADELNEAQVRNFARWSSAPPRTSWAWEIQHLKDWMASRLDWMDQQFTRPATSNAPLPGGGEVAPGFSLALTSPSTVRPGAQIYYTTDGTDPRLPETALTHPMILVPLNAPARGLLPTSDIGTAWRGSSQTPDPFDDSAWLSGANGIGYDDVADYNAYIGINFEFPNPVMKNVMGSAYMRMKFNLTAADLGSIQRMELRVRYDDGFAAFLNGVQIASANPPVSLAWNALASASHADAEAVKLLPFDVSAFVSALHLGENVLALHGANSPINSTDFLVQAELAAGPDAPEISPSAQTYTSPLTIADTSHLFVRVFDPAGPFTPYPYTGAGAGNTPVGSHWSAPLRLSLLVNTVPAAFGNLVISEIMYAPPATTPAESAAGYDRDDFEYIVLRNIGNSTLNLTGIRLTGGVEFTAALGPQSALAPGASAVVTSRTGAFAQRYGAPIPVLGDYAGHLSKTGDSLTLLSATGAVIQTLTFDDAAPWPSEAAGGGYSLVLINAASNPPAGSALSWRSSLDPMGEIPGTLPATFEDWRLRHFDPGAVNFAADSAPLADPDGDGLSNAVECATGLSPTSANGAPLRFVQVGNQLFAEFERRTGFTDLVVSLECSDDISGWVLPALEPPQPNGRGTETLRAPIGSAGSGREFYRLQVQSQ